MTGFQGEAFLNDFSSMLWTAFWAVVLGAATVAVAQVVAKVLRHALSRDSVALPSASIVINIARAAVWVVGGSIILDGCFGINANALLAALGVGGIAISLGFQDTLSNLIGGLQLTFLGIIAPGDNIEVGTVAGVVQDVTWRHTTVKDPLGQTVVIPNSVIAKTSLVHLVPAERVSVSFTVPRAAGSDLDGLAGALAEAVRGAAGAVSPIADGPVVRFSEIGELGIKGKVSLQIGDAAQASVVKDAIVRAIAPLVG